MGLLSLWMAVVVFSDSSSAIWEVLVRYNDAQLSRVTQYYAPKLHRVMIELAEEISSSLTGKTLFKEDLKRVQELVAAGQKGELVKFVVSLFLENGARVGRAFWSALLTVDHPHPELQAMFKEILEQGSSLPFIATWSNLSEVLPDYRTVIKAAQLQHKEKLLAELEKMEAQRVAETKIGGGRGGSLGAQGREGYPELVTIISTLEESAAAHEQLAWNTLTDGDDQEEERRNWGQFVKRPMEPMDPTYELFGTSFTACLSDGLTVLGGGPGMGKTVALRRLLAQWATSQAETGPEAFYPQFHFALYFELGRGTEEPCSLESLVTRAYPHLGRLLPYLWQTPESLLLVFDGLERLKGWPEGATGSSLMEPQDEAAVPALLWAMCQGRLLAGCTLLICGRHQALRPFQQTGVQLWVEAAGLGEASRRAYAAGLAPRRGEPPSTALERAQGQSDYLRGLCREPAYCWLVCCSPLDPTEGPLPRTTTQLLATYLRGALREEQQAPGGLPGLVSRLGDLALEGLAQRTLRFREEDFRRHGLEASSLGRGLVQRVGQAYAFPQPPLQEFLAALAQYLAEDGRSLLELLHAAHGSDDGRYQGYLRFLLGLSSRSSSRALEGLLPPLPHRAVCDAILWLEGLVQSEGKKREVSRRRLLNVAHYLHEARNQRLARQLARSVSRLPLGSEKPQAGIRLDPPDCAALAYVFRHCESIDTFSFDNCYVQAEGIRHLLPAFLNCKRISLVGNYLCDEGVRTLCMVLRDSDCKVTELQLAGNSLSPGCTADIISAVITNPSITGLGLNNNNLGDAGAMQLAEGVQHPNCRIENIQLDRNRLSEVCAEGLSSMLLSHLKIRWLIIDKNSLGNAGLRTLCAGIKGSRIHRLGMSYNSLSDAVAEELVSALCVNRTIQFLQLTGNYFTDQSVSTFIHLILTCQRLQKLWLVKNPISEESKRLLLAQHEKRADLVVAL